MRDCGRSAVSRRSSITSLGSGSAGQPRSGPACADDRPIMRTSTQEFEGLPLRVHDFLAGVPLHDVWAVDLPRLRAGITLDEFLRAAGARPFTPSPVVRAL